MSDAFVAAAAAGPDDAGRTLYDFLRAKWTEVPAGLGSRVETERLAQVPDHALRAFWLGVHAESTMGPGGAVRGWYHTLYAPVFAGRRVLEVGSGMGIDAVHFIAHGADWHCADLSPRNLELITRTCVAMGLEPPGTTVIEDLTSLAAIPDGFDFIYCQGSLINVPFEFARAETRLLLSHLGPGGRWIELAYPRERWAREGRVPFAEWGEITDGEGTPWVEWYDLERLRARLAPTLVDPILAFNFHRDEFNWFDLRVDDPPPPVTVAEAFTFPGATDATADVDLASVSRTAHNDVAVEIVDGALSAASATDRWSYALHFEVEDLLAGHDRANAVLEADVVVAEGSLGVGLMDASLTDFVSAELIVDAAPGGHTLLLPVADDARALMFRNVDGSGTATRFGLQSLRISRRADPAAERTRLWGPSAASLHIASTLHGAGEGGTARADGLGWVEVVPPSGIGTQLGLDVDLTDVPGDLLRDPLDWRMDPDDARLLRAIYAATGPLRHLEIGTWEGFGVVLVATSAPGVEVTTVNLPEGELTAGGQLQYPAGGLTPTDGGSSIGRLYRAAGLGDRVRQVLADSTEWQPDLPDGHFDSVLIDGGHTADVVAADTALALRMVRPGGLVMWHDFCPVPRVLGHSDASHGVVTALAGLLPSLVRDLDRLFWIRPSFLLVGRRAS